MRDHVERDRYAVLVIAGWDGAMREVRGEHDQSAGARVHPKRPRRCAIITRRHEVEFYRPGVGIRIFVGIGHGDIIDAADQPARMGMPFLMAADKFARQALDAIAAGVGLRVIPWQMGVLARILRILPNWIYDRALAGRPRKARKSQ